MRLNFGLFSKMPSRTFLFWFANEHTNFRFHEFEALFKVFQLDLKIFSQKKVAGPYVLMDFEDDEAPKKLMSRSVLAHSCYEVWGQGTSRQELHEDIKNNFDKTVPYKNSSFQVRVDTFGKSLKYSEKLGWIDSLTYLPLEGKIDLKTPECSLHFVLYYGVDSNNLPEEPYNLYFGRWVCDGQKKMVTKINLKDRKFIGNTSMDPRLSLLMTNLAGVKPMDIVFDPFVGTGSLLVAAASMGAQVIGSDIDYLMLHGLTRSTRAFQVTRSKDENIRANMVQYGLESKYVDVIISDASRPLWRDDIRFDAIIADPPYGIRESIERLGSRKEREPGFKVKEEHLATHYPAKTVYTLTEIICDLMNFSTKRLEIGGRLVYWIPISRNEYDADKLPKNPCLSLVSNNEQMFTSFASRRLLVFEKLREPTESCETIMDGSAPMYNFKSTYFETGRYEDKAQFRKDRKEKYAGYLKPTKSGQNLLRSSELKVHESIN